MRSSPNSAWAEVVGVVGHIRHESLESDQRMQIYWNYLQRARDQLTLVAHFGRRGFWSALFSARSKRWIQTNRPTRFAP
jgi:hypothetical protein